MRSKNSGSQIVAPVLLGEPYKIAEVAVVSDILKCHCQDVLAEVNTIVSDNAVSVGVLVTHQVEHVQNVRWWLRPLLSMRTSR